MSDMKTTAYLGMIINSFLEVDKEGKKYAKRSGNGDQFHLVTATQVTRTSESGCDLSCRHISAPRSSIYAMLLTQTSSLNMFTST